MSTSAACAFLILVPGLLLGCRVQGESEGVLAVASSLRGLIEWSEERFQTESPGEGLEFSFAASSTLARQIESGAGYELFLSADRACLERIGALMGASVRILDNRLALVAGSAADPRVRSPEQLAAAIERAGSDAPWIAIAAEAVPAGRYAREYLASHGLLVRLEERFVLGDNALKTLALVESGAARFGFVYFTDPLAAQTTEVRWSTLQAEPPQISYFAATSPDARPRVIEFLEWLQGDTFRSEAERRGFLRPDR